MRYILFLLLLPGFSSLANEYDSSSRLQSLFTTVHERNQLDKLRDSGRYLPGTNSSDSTTSNRSFKVEMQGVLIQGKRKAVAFINDQNTSHSIQLENNIRVNINKLKTSDYSVPVQINDKPVKLKPGQQWDESSRQVKDKFQIKQIKQKTSGLDTATGTDIMQ